MPNNDDLIWDFEEEVLPNTTWKIDFEKNIVTSNITDLDAVKQSVLLILNCERYEHLIFSDQYGIELLELFGESQPYTMSELKRRVTEALIQDDRIISVDNFEFNRTKRALHATFTVDSNVGEFNAETEVAL